MVDNEFAFESEELFEGILSSVARKEVFIHTGCIYPHGRQAG